jgi:hypothetical protein
MTLHITAIGKLLLVRREAAHVAVALGAARIEPLLTLHAMSQTIQHACSA